jgi:hypothetical protein
MMTTTTHSLNTLVSHLHGWFPEYSIHLNDIMPDNAYDVVMALEQIEGFKYDDGYMPFITIPQSAMIKALNHMLENEKISQEAHDAYVNEIEKEDYNVFVFSFH